MAEEPMRMMPPVVPRAGETARQVFEALLREWGEEAENGSCDPQQTRNEVPTVKREWLARYDAAVGRQG